MAVYFMALKASVDLDGNDVGVVNHLVLHQQIHRLEGLATNMALEDEDRFLPEVVIVHNFVNLQSRRCSEFLPADSAEEMLCKILSKRIVGVEIVRREARPIHYSLPASRSKAVTVR